VNLKIVVLIFIGIFYKSWKIFWHYISNFLCVILPQDWKDAFWGKFGMGVPRPRSPSELRSQASLARVSVHLLGITRRRWPNGESGLLSRSSRLDRKRRDLCPYPGHKSCGRSIAGSYTAAAGRLPLRSAGVCRAIDTVGAEQCLKRHGIFHLHDVSGNKFGQKIFGSVINSVYLSWLIRTSRYGHALKRSSNNMANSLRAACHSRKLRPPFSKLRIADRLVSGPHLLSGECRAFG
jgi:hypothetical protein